MWVGFFFPSVVPPTKTSDNTTKEYLYLPSIYFLDNITAVYDTTLTATDGVVLIALCMGLTRAEAWVFEFIHPYGHIFISE